MSLAPEVKGQIQEAYSQFLKARGLQPRHGQKLMIAAIARTLGNIQLDNAGKRTGANGICVIEAGTGTGKTVAYLLGVLPIAKALNKTVVVSTATIALQEQILLKDLPELKQHSGLDFSYAIAKGRGRYLCLSKLDRLLATDGDPPLFAGDDKDWNLGVSASDLTLYKDMMGRLGEGAWDGDRDNWPNELDTNSWSRVTTDHRQCTGRRCSFVRQCAFFKARDNLVDTDLVVANHDLVLADLALGGGAILSPPEDTIYVLDEGHHLAEKALNHFSAHTRIQATVRWLGQTEGQWPNFIAPLAEASHFQALAMPVEPALKECRALLESSLPMLRDLAATIARSERFAQTPRHRFARGETGAELEQLASGLVQSFTKVSSLFEKLYREVEKLLENEHGPVPIADLEDAFAALGGWCARIESSVALWRSYANTQADPQWPMARWLSVLEFNDAEEFELVSSPVLASKTLDETLWQVCCAAVVTSATLTALGSFERFKLRAGTPEHSHYEAVPSPFDFVKNAVLRVPRAAVEGNRVQEHTESLIQLLPQIIDDKAAALVLFSSKRQMEEVLTELPENFRKKVLMQGAQTKQVLLQKHKAAVDQDHASVLFGLASFAEGVDLPGRYCEHVVIAKIPFSVPDDPVEAAMAEWVEAQGGNAFMQLSVPDAAIRLVQACGRLLRHEDDTGVITILDKRLLTKRYGSAILDSLPAFKRELDQ